MVVPVELRQLADRAAPVTLARDRALPVVAPLRPLFPDAGLTRGSVVGVTGAAGATSLALATAAGASQAGSWTVVVGLPELGLVAAAETGVALDRLAMVTLPPHDPASWAPVLAALVGAVDVVVVDGRLSWRSGATRRLAARARERGTVVVPVVPGGTRRGFGGWVVDLTLRADDAWWEGLADGHGYLRRRRIGVTADGRGRSAHPRRAELWLPSAGGGVVDARGDIGETPSNGVGRDDAVRAVRAGLARTERFLRSVSEQAS